MNSAKDFAFPIIDDSDRRLATQLGMIDPAEIDNKGLPLTARAVRKNCFFFSTKTNVVFRCSLLVLIRRSKPVFSIRRHPVETSSEFFLFSFDHHSSSLAKSFVCWILFNSRLVFRSPRPSIGKSERK